MKQRYIIGIGIVIILLLAGAVWVWQKGTEPDGITPTPPTPVEPVEPTTPQEPDSVQVPEGWKTYRNEELGFQLAYPGEWFLYDRETFVKDDSNNTFGPCITGGDGLRNATILSKTDLGRCVDQPGSGQIRGDFVIEVFSSTINVDVEGGEEITLDKVKGIKKITIKEAPNPFTSYFTFVQANFKEKTYLILLRQLDHKGNYSSIFDQILSNFRFLE